MCWWGISKHLSQSLILVIVDGVLRLRCGQRRDALLWIFCYVILTKIVFTKDTCRVCTWFCNVFLAIQFSSRSAVGKFARCDFLAILLLNLDGNFFCGVKVINRRRRGRNVIDAGQASMTSEHGVRTVKKLGFSGSKFHVSTGRQTTDRCARCPC